MSGSFLLLGAAMALGADAPPPVVAIPAPPPVTAPALAPIVVGGGAGCVGCGSAPAAWGATYAPATSSWSSSSCDSCGSGGRVGLFARLKARFSRNDCAPAWTPAPACGGCGVAAPVYHAPAPVYHAPALVGMTTGCGCSDPCQRDGLLARLFAKFRSGRARTACASPVSSCGGSWGAPVAGGCASGFDAGLSAPAVGGCAPAFGTVLPGTAIPGTPQVMPNPEPKKEEPKKEEPKKDPPKELGLKPAPSPLPSVDIPRVPVLGGTTGKY